MRGLVAPFLVALFFLGPGAGVQGNEINDKLVPNLEPLVDKPHVPDFSLPKPDGKKLRLRDFRGKVVLLNFWASWCLPCREEMPSMERLYREFKNRDFVVVAVNVKDKKKDALAFVKELRLSYPVLLDPEGEVGLLYGAWGLPTSYLIGRKGEGLARIWGPADWYSPGARKLVKALADAKR